MKIKLNSKSIEVVEEKGNHWVKGNFDRYYINAFDLIHVNFYKSGNVSDAWINGERISNSHAYRLDASKLFMEDGVLVSENEELLALAMEILDLEEYAEEAEAEDKDEDVAEEVKEVVSFVEADNGFEVKENGSSFGTLVFDVDRHTWVLWSTDGAGSPVGVDYFADLQDTKESVTDDLVLSA